MWLHSFNELVPRGTSISQLGWKKPERCASLSIVDKGVKISVVMTLNGRSCKKKPFQLVRRYWCLEEKCCQRLIRLHVLCSRKIFMCVQVSRPWHQRHPILELSKIVPNHHLNGWLFGNYFGTLSRVSEGLRWKYYKTKVVCSGGSG